MLSGAEGEGGAWGGRCIPAGGPHALAVDVARPNNRLDPGVGARGRANVAPSTR